MKNIILIAKREFLTQAKKKSFIILTILTPLLLVGFGWAVALIMQSNKSENTINVIDKSGWFQGKLNSTEEISYVFSAESSEANLKKALETTDDMNGVLVIPKAEDISQLDTGIQLFTNKNIGLETRIKISDEISEVIKTEKIKKLGIDLAQIKNLDKPVNLQIINILEKDKTENQLHTGVKSALSMLLMYIVFTFIMLYGVRIMRSVLEEKNTRVVEIIISSVKPFELMMGKIFGVAAVAFVQFGVWILMTLVSFKFIGSPNSGVMANSGEKVQMIFSTLSEFNYGLILFVFIVYFILGYLFYSAMYAAIGSAVDNETETQQFTTLAILPMMLGVYGSITIMNNPDGPMSFWLSMIPFTSPIAMIARIPFDVPAWELALSIAILLLSVLGMVFIASKIYRVGILMYGNKVTFKELWKWIKE